LKVAVAVTIPAPGGNVTVAVAVEFASEPLRADVVAVVGVPVAGKTLLTVVPSALLAAPSIAIAESIAGERDIGCRQSRRWARRRCRSAIAVTWLIRALKRSGT
jgi:hypothetical protein